MYEQKLFKGKILLKTKLQEEINKVLSHFPEYWENKELLKSKLIEDLRNYKAELIQSLLNNNLIKETYSLQIEDNTIFKLEDFVSMLRFKNYLPNSYTKYSNEIGLTSEGKYLQYNSDVVLDFPYKDTVLEGGMTKEDVGKDEVFYHNILAKEEIDTLLSPKVLSNIKKYDAKGEHEVTEFSDNDNLIVKGNNLVGLHSLKERFAGKVKLIYIDPPYNTGGDSFMYNDRFNHSSWLTFMKNRMEIAKELLKDDGIIFIQCDDNEQAYLKILLDEIFLKENMICNFIWRKKTGASDAKNIAVVTEYVLCYAKNAQVNMFKFNVDSFNNSRYRLTDEHEERRGKYYIDNLDRGGLSYSDSLNYPIKCPDGTYTYPNGRTEYENDGWIWKWGKEKVKWALDNDFLEFRKSKTKQSGWSVCYKNYIYVNNENKPIKRSAPYKNLITDVLNNDGAKEIKKLFDKKVFSYPKSEKLLYKFIDIATNESDIVLDFFMGSSTTQAVAHKMNRQYIGIEQMDYINTVSIPRLQKVIDGEQGGISKEVSWRGGGSFVYAELQELNQIYVDKIQQVSSKEELPQVIDDMKEQALLDFKIDLEKVSIENEDFAGLSLEEQKALLINVLDENQLYLNYSEIDDSQYDVSEDVKQFNRSFYEGIDTHG